MKLRNLNGLIRKNEGSVKMEFTTAAGVLTVGLVKSELIAGLAVIYTDGQDETGLTIEDGYLKHESDEGRVAAARRMIAMVEGDEWVDMPPVDVSIDPHLEAHGTLAIDPDVDFEDLLDLGGEFVPAAAELDDLLA